VRPPRRGSNDVTYGPMKPRLGVALCAAGAVLAIAAAAIAPVPAVTAAERTWPPFVLVAGLLVIGLVANEDGLFRAVAAPLSRIGSGLAIYAVAMALVALVTVFLNLDTSVAFLTPVLVHLARSRGSGEDRFLYGCVFMSNAASLLLPGSNLTNLLILADEHISGSRFLASMAAPWLAAVLATAIIVAIAFPDARGSAPPQQPGPPLSWLSLASIVLAAALILLLADSALPVLAVGLALAGIRLAQRRLSLRRVLACVDVLSLLGVFLVAVAFGTLSAIWSAPAAFLRTASDAQAAAVGAVAAVLINNLPAAGLLGSQLPAHPRSLLLGLNIGPNLAVTGSLSALLWWQTARSIGARPSASRYSAVGLVLVPLTLAAALAAERVPLL